MKKKLLPITLLCLMGLVACGNKTPTASPTPSKPQPTQPTKPTEPTKPVTPTQPTAPVTPTPSKPTQPTEPAKDVYAVEITNAEALTAEWRVGDAKRTMTLSATKNGEVQNAVQLMAAGELTVETSDAAVVSNVGLVLTAEAEGEVKILVKYHDAEASISLKVLARKTNKDKFGTEHDGTEEDPFTNEDALIVAKYYEVDFSAQDQDLYIKGEIDSFYHAPGSGNKGDKTVVSWYYKAAQEGGERFEAYIVKKADASEWTEDELWVGAIVTLKVSKFAVYNGQYETASGQSEITKIEGTKPEVVTHEVNVAGAIEEGRKLAHQGSTADKYAVTGYVVKKSGSNFFMSDTNAVAEHDYDMFEIYQASADEAKLLTKGAKVTVTCTLKRYGQTDETCQIENAVISEIKVLEAGGTWEEVPEPAVETKTLAQFIALENSAAKAYNVTANIKAFKDGETKDEYGNMTLTDGENDLIIYGSSATASALAWNKADAYVFTNPKDFLSNAATKDLAVGAEITMKLIRADYKGTVQGKGIIIVDTPTPTPTPTETPEPTVPEAEGIKLTDVTLLGYEGTNISYHASESDVTVDGVTFAYTELGAYGNGIQMRVKNGNASSIWNTAAFSKAIKEINIKLNDDKDVHSNENVWQFDFGTAAGTYVEADAIKLSTVENQRTYTITPTGAPTFFKMTKILNQYSFYVDYINIVLVD